MAVRSNTFLLKRSNVAGKIPTQLTLGELALNTADVILYASGTTSNSILPIGWDRVARTGDTLTGDFIINGGITATTISATTYQNLPPYTDNFTTASTLINQVVYFDRNDTLSAYTLNLSGLDNYYVNVSGDTMTGNLTVPNITATGITATTISATTYLNIPSNTGLYLPLSGGTVTGATVFQSGLTANTFYTDSIQFNPSAATPTFSTGQVYWNFDDGTLDVNTSVVGVTLQVGQENHVKVVNKTGSLIPNGAIVYIDGAQGNRPTVTLADYTQEISSSKVLGMVTADIIDNEEGFVTTQGLVRELNTSGYTGGTLLWLYTGGTYTEIKPAAPYHAVFIGVVVVEHQNQGIIYVQPQNGYELEELHNVLISSGVTNDEVLTYDLASLTWKNKPPKEFTGGTVTGATNFTGGLTANTISATTYYNLPTDVYVSGGTYNNNTFTFSNTTGGSFNVFFDTVTGLTVNGNLSVTGNTNLNNLTATTISATTYLNYPSSTFTGGTVSGATNFTGGLTANTFTATSISCSTLTVSGVTFNKLLIEKVGVAPGTSFAGSPRVYTVVFASNFPNTNYGILITGGDSRSFTYTNQTVSGFTINSNAAAALANNVYWMAKQIGEV